MAPSRWLVFATLLWLASFARCTHPSVVSPSSGSLTASTRLRQHDELEVSKSGAARRPPGALRSELGADARGEWPMIDGRREISQPPPPESPLPLLAPQGPGGSLHFNAPASAAAAPAELTGHRPLLLPSKRRRTGLVLSLGAVSGLAHVFCSFRYEYYANMMTGNTIRWTLATSRADAALATFFGTVVLSYLLGASLYRILDLFMMFQSTRAAGAEPRWTDPLHCDRHKLRNLSWMSPISLVTFCSSDVVHRLMRRSNSASSLRTTVCRLSSLAVGFGMVNAAAQDYLNAVTNAATGHITRLGLGVVDKALLWHGAIGTRRAGSSSESVSPAFSVRAAVRSTSESTNLSFQFLTVLISSLVLSSVACRRRWIPLDELDSVLGTLFGVAYATLLFWYTSPFVESPWRRWCVPYRASVMNQ